MKFFRSLLLVAAALCAALPAHAVGCWTNGQGVNGNGPSSPGVPQCSEFTYPYNGDYTRAHFTVTTAQPGDLLIGCYWEVNGATSPDVDRYCYYDSNRTTTHSGVISGFMPGGRGNYLLSFSSCGTVSAGSGRYGQNCAKTDSNMSVAPWGAAQSNGLNFSTGNPTSGAFNWVALPGAGTQTFWIGDTNTLAISNQWLSGAIPSTFAYLIVTGITVDRQGCSTPVNGVMSCGSANMKVQYSQDNTTVPSPGQNNISGSYVLTSGTYNGHYFNQQGSGAFHGPFNNFLLISPQSGATTCTNFCHTVVISFLPTNSSQVSVGPSSTLTYTFNVQNHPTYTPSSPMSFAAIPGMANYWAYLADYGKPLGQCTSALSPYAFCGVGSAVEMTKAETNFPGYYFGGDSLSAGLSSTPLNGLAMWNYDGPRVAYGVGDMLATQTKTWGQESSTPTQWDPITDGTNVEVETVAGCTKGSSAPAWVQSCTDNPSGPQGCITADNTCRWMDVGSSTYWNGIAERVWDQMRDTYLIRDHFTTDSEFNRFGDGGLMHCFRNFSPCNTTRLDYKAIGYFFFPFITNGTWATTNQRIIQNQFIPQTDTIRDTEYEMDALLDYWVIKGSNPLDVNGLDIIKPRVDTMFGDVHRIPEYSPTDGGTQFPIAGGLGAPGFDNGLVTESLIHYGAVQNYFHQTVDTRLYSEVPALLDWFFSNQYNLTGSDHATPYTWWTEPYGSQLCPPGSGCTWNQSDLAALYLPAYAWWGMNCNNCVLPTSGVHTFDAADEMFQHLFDNVSGSTKEFTQLFKWLPEYFGWRNGTLAGNDSLILPSHNSYLGSTTQVIECYPQGSYPGSPVVSASGGTVTASWFDNCTQGIQNLVLDLDQNCTGHVTQQYTCPASGRTAYGQGADTLFADSCSVTNVPAGTYCVGVGATDTSGRTGVTAIDVNNGTEHWQVTTTFTGLTISTTSPLPQADLLKPYTTSVTASGGTGSGFTWTIQSGTLPPGTSLTSGTPSATIAGTPNTAGTSSFTLKVTDSGGNVASKAFNLTVATALTITTASLPNGAINQGYPPTQITTSGGTTPLTWSATGLPTGLTLSALTGTLMGTPTVSGSYSPTFTATDRYGQQAQATLSLTIASGSNLAISTSSCPDSENTVAYAGCTITGTGGSGSGYTWCILEAGGTCDNGSTGALPSGLTIALSGTPSTSITGTPNNPSGIYNFTVRLTDSLSNQVTKVLSIHNFAALSITTTDPMPGGEKNVAYSQTVTTVGGNGSFMFTISAGSLPTGLSINSSTGAITGTPSGTGTSSFTVQVVDTLSGSTTQALHITIVDDPSITTTSPLPSGLINQPYSTTLAAHNGVLPYSWSATGLPTGLTINSVSGVISGTPTASGTFSVMASVTDANGQVGNATLSLTILSNAGAGHTSKGTKKKGVISR